MGCVGSTNGDAALHDRYELGEKLGQGAFGQVRAVRAKEAAEGEGGALPPPLAVKAERCGKCKDSADLGVQTNSVIRFVCLATVCTATIAPADSLQACTSGASCTQIPGEHCRKVLQVCMTTSPGRIPVKMGMGDQACASGTYAAGENNVRCSNCEPGRFQTEDGATRCFCAPAGYIPNSDGNAMLPCKPGTYAETDCSAECTKCEKGHYTNLSGMPECECAEAGHQVNDDHTMQFPCLPGHRQPSRCMESCLKCDPGKYASTTGAHDCRCARKGHTSTLDGTGERECGPGSYSAESCSSSCMQCKEGRYASLTGMHDCLCADPGYSVNEDSTMQLPCRPGQYQPSRCMGSCLTCTPGKYFSTTGAHNCHCAPKGHTSTLDRTGVKECGPGSFSAQECSEECTLCAAGRYSNHSSNAGCMATLPGYYQALPGQGSFETCPRGSYTDKPESVMCKDCGIFYFTHGLGSTRCYSCWQVDMDQRFSIPEPCRGRWIFLGICASLLLVAFIFIRCGVCQIFYRCRRAARRRQEEQIRDSRMAEFIVHQVENMLTTSGTCEPQRTVTPAVDPSLSPRRV